MMESDIWAAVCVVRSVCRSWSWTTAPWSQTSHWSTSRVASVWNALSSMTASRSPAQASNESGSVEKQSQLPHIVSTVTTMYRLKWFICRIQMCSVCLQFQQDGALNTRDGLEYLSDDQSRKHNSIFNFTSVTSINKHVKNGPHIICPWLQCH